MNEDASEAIRSSGHAGRCARDAGEICGRKMRARCSSEVTRVLEEEAALVRGRGRGRGRGRAKGRVEEGVGLGVGVGAGTMESRARWASRVEAGDRMRGRDRAMVRVRVGVGLTIRAQ